MQQRLENLLKRHGLVEIKFTGEQAEAAMRVFKERTEGLLEIAWRKAWRLEDIQKAVEQYGFDCYQQGVCDGARVATDNPSLREAIRPPLGSL